MYVCGSLLVNVSRFFLCKCEWVCKQGLCVYVCVCEKERQSERESLSVCVCVFVCVCVCARAHLGLVFTVFGMPALVGVEEGRGDLSVLDGVVGGGGKSLADL